MSPIVRPKTLLEAIQLRQVT